MMTAKMILSNMRGPEVRVGRVRSGLGKCVKDPPGARWRRVGLTSLWVSSGMIFTLFQTLRVRSTLNKILTKVLHASVVPQCPVS